MRKNDQTEDEEILWIIRFSDNSLTSFVGTKEDARKAADERAAELGTSYIIT